jgi:signal transduction histidine kinase
MANTTAQSLPPVLVVDDERDNLDALRRLLRNQYEVVAVDSAFEALKELQRRTFHVIVSDQRMPEMTGVELLEKAKTLRPSATRILLTGYTDIESVIGAINRGNIWRYIAKPWDPEELKLTLRQANEAYELRAALEERNRALEVKTAELAEAVRALEALDRAKSRFLSLVSHELNTPLTVLSAFLELLVGRKDALEPEVRQSVESLAQASARLGTIVSDVLLFTRLEASGVAKLEVERVAPLVERALERVKAAAESRSLVVTPTLGATALGRLEAEPFLLGIERIAAEVFRRSKPGSKVGVDLAASEGAPAMTFSWTGEPILPEAFEPFEPGGDFLHHHRNLGLGLAIARRALDRNGIVAKLVQAGGTHRLVLRIPAVDNVGPGR